MLALTEDPNNWNPSHGAGRWRVIEVDSDSDANGLTAEQFIAELNALRAKAKALVDAVGFDDNGAMVAGRWIGGNGGLLSRETIAAADALRGELDRWK